MDGLNLNIVSVQLGGHTVLDRASAQLSPGKLYVMVGPNGAGKSTLLKAMAALLPVSTGNISLNGAEISRLSPQRRAEEIAYLPQDRTIAWDLPCVDVAALGAYHLLPELARQRALEALQSLGLADLAERGVFSLSGGQRARVLLARVLVSPAKIYLLDEPLMALDPAWQRQVLVRLRQRADAGHTVVVSLHDLQLAAQFADEILLLHAGRLVKVGTPESLFTPSALREIFGLKGELVVRNGKRALDIDSVPIL